jgi:hypothetical protein
LWYLTHAISGAHILLEPIELILLMFLLNAIDMLPQIDLEGMELGFGDTVGCGGPPQALPEHCQDLRVELFDAVAQPDPVIPQDL